MTDPSFAAGVELQGGNVGGVQGEGRDQLMRVTVYTTQSTQPKMKSGEAVVTSGLDNEKFPKGIPVGRVESVQPQVGGAEPEILLTPLVDVDQLSYLQVLEWSPEGSVP